MFFLIGNALPMGGTVTSASGRVQFCNSMLNRTRIMLESSTNFGKFLLDFGLQFCVAGAVFGEVGG